MLLTPEPELDFLAAIKIAVSSKAKHWQLPNKACNKKKNGDIFTKYSKNHQCYNSQGPPLMEKVSSLQHC